MGTPVGQKNVSLLERCPHFRGFVGKEKVSLFQGSALEWFHCNICVRYALFCHSHLYFSVSSSVSFFLKFMLLVITDPFL